MEFAWFNVDGRQIYRRVPEHRETRSAFPCPQIRSDRIAPVQSMADGEWYDSMSALRRTYKAGGNPQRQDYIEIGDEPMKGPPQMPRMTKQEVADLLDKSQAMIARGEAPQVSSLDDPS